jgi:hypothetical protein
MKIVRNGLACLYALGALALAGCATSATPRLNVDVDTCCEANFYQFDTYAVTMGEMPGFLEPYLRSGLATVLAEKGLRSTVDSPDLRVVIRFDQIFLDEATGEEVANWETVEPHDETRFVASVTVEMFDTRNDHLVWSGRMSRIHTNPYGQPRGNDHKMQGIIDGFNELFARYPIRLRDDPGEEAGSQPPY